MSQRITIDPITRIEGHLRIDCEIEGGVVTKGTVVRHHVARDGGDRQGATTRAMPG